MLMSPSSLWLTNLVTIHSTYEVNESEKCGRQANELIEAAKMPKCKNVEMKMPKCNGTVLVAQTCLPSGTEPSPSITV